jgi:hypothetical protein
MCGVLVTVLSACRYELAINGCEAFAIVTIRRKSRFAMMQDFKRPLQSESSGSYAHRSASPERHHGCCCHL